MPPERAPNARPLPALYSLRSERRPRERIDTDLIFRWFLDLQPGDDAFDPAVFSPNRQRLDDGEPTRAPPDAVAAEALTAGLCSERSPAGTGTGWCWGRRRRRRAARRSGRRPRRWRTS